MKNGHLLRGVRLTVAVSMAPVLPDPVTERVLLLPNGIDPAEASKDLSSTFFKEMTWTCPDVPEPTVIR